MMRGREGGGGEGGRGGGGGGDWEFFFQAQKSFFTYIFKHHNADYNHKDEPHIHHTDKTTTTTVT